MRNDLERRLEALEEGSGPIIDDLADYVKWCYEGCPPLRWNPKFERQIEELTKEVADEDIRE